MESKPEHIIGTPPRLITSLVAGFNTVANNIYLIALPVLIDLFLWLGPHLQIKTIFQTFLTDMLKTVQQVGTPDMIDLFTTSQKIWQAAIDQLNIFSSLRTWPVGVPSLLAPLFVPATPLGSVSAFEMTDFGATLGTWLLIMLGGVLAGVLYFQLVAVSSAGAKQSLSVRLATWQFWQSILLATVLIVIAIVAAFPIGAALMFSAALSPALAQIGFLLITFLALWFLLPLVFSAHGIFMFNLNAFISMLTSVRLVRFFMPGTGMFLVVAVLLNEGLNILWRIPPADSWMATIGILGHAFIATGLLSASFIYYLGGMRWMQENLQKLAAQQPAKA